MLSGVLRYTDEVKGVVEYEVYAQSSFDSFKFYLQATTKFGFDNYHNALFLYDMVSSQSPDTGEVVVSNPYWGVATEDNRRLDIKSTNKYTSNITNRVFCSRIAALLRYAQIEGSKRVKGVNLDDDYFEVERRASIDNLGFLVMNTGLITSLNLKSPFVELVLNTTSDILEDTIFKPLKAKDKFGNSLSATPLDRVGFKLSESLLGFPYVPPFEREPANLLGMYETIEEVIEANPDKNTAWILDRNYNIVTDDNLEAVIKEMQDADWLSFDTETTGLNINFKSRTGEGDQLVGVILTKERGSGYYFPLQHKLFPNLCGGDHWFFMEYYMKPLLESKNIIVHNGAFDWKVAYIYSINTNIVYDTMLAFGVTKRYEMPSFELKLKSLAKNILGLDMFDLSDFVFSSSFSDSGVTFADLPYELVRRYAPADGDMTLSLFEYIERTGLLGAYQARSVFDMEVNFSKVVAYSEFWGYHINTEKVPEMYEAITSNMEKYKQEMFNLAGKEFNPNSPKQLSTIMYDELEIETVGDSRSTAKDILKTLADRTDSNGDPLYPFVLALKHYRDNEGIFKNFLKRLPEFASRDGFIFPGVLQLGTDTGRSSVQNPNYQSYNDPVKQNIVPRKDYFHFDCDFSQIEYRVLASMAKQESLMEAFDDPDLDYHTYQAARMHSIPYALVSKKLRSESKGINFGLPYGMGDSSLGLRIFGKRSKENEQKAKVLRRKFFQGQEKIETFFEVVRSSGVSNNYTSTHWNRRRYYNRGQYTVAEIRRQAGNHVIQGTAADIYKIACNRLWNRCVAEGWLDLVIFNGFIHDELLLEVHKSVNPYYFFKAWREEFEVSVEGFCKLYAGAGVGRSWYQAKKQDLPVQYITTIINQYDEDMVWDENIEGFLQRVDEGYKQYKIDRVKEYITDTTNSGEIIKPVISSLLNENVDAIVSLLQSSSASSVLLAEYNALFDTPLIPPSGKHHLKLLRDFIKVFSHFYHLEDKVVPLRSADEVEVRPSSEVTDAPSGGNDLTLTFDDASLSLEELVLLHGYYLDEASNVLHLQDRSLVYQGLNTSVLNLMKSRGELLTEGRYQLALLNPDGVGFTYFKAYLSENGYQTLGNLYRAARSSSLFATTVYSVPVQ